MKKTLLLLVFLANCGQSNDCTVGGWLIWHGNRVEPYTCAAWQQAIDAWSTFSLMSLEDHHNFRWQYLEIRTANHHWWAHPPGGAALVAGQAWPTRARIKVNLNRQDYPTLCNTALYHELVHIWGARFHGDSDATHSRTEWWDELVWVRQECGQLYFNTLAAGHVD